MEDLKSALREREWASERERVSERVRVRETERDVLEYEHNRTLEYWTTRGGFKLRGFFTPASFGDMESVP